MPLTPQYTWSQDDGVIVMASVHALVCAFVRAYGLRVCAPPSFVAAAFVALILVRERALMDRRPPRG
jgi:hypothetical protein